MLLRVNEASRLILKETIHFFPFWVGKPRMTDRPNGSLFLHNVVNEI